MSNHKSQFVPRENRINHSRKPRETTRTTQCRKMAEKSKKMAGSKDKDNLSNIESEDEEITRILGGRHPETTLRATKKALKMDLHIEKCSTKSWQIVLCFLWLIFRYNISSLQEIFRRIPLTASLEMISILRVFLFYYRWERSGFFCENIEELAARSRA